jgi:pimeloyl-ACP methyl ester carboxylesterase
VRKENITTHSSATQERPWKSGALAVHRHAGETVILVHGLWTPAAVFALHSHWLQQRGYRALRFGYPSVRATLSQNAQALRGFIAATNAADIHLVGHSLGGLIILDMLAQAPGPRLRRVVLLGTPCLDSHCARRLAAVAGIPLLLGRSIMEWLPRGPGAAVVPRSAVEVAVLAGTRSVGLGRVVPGLPQPNDGVVALEETRLPGAADFIALPIAHSAMLASRRCAAQIASFLEAGHFLHDEQV